MLIVDILEHRRRRESRGAVDGVPWCCRSAGTVQTGPASSQWPATTRWRQTNKPTDRQTNKQKDVAVAVGSWKLEITLITHERTVSSKTTITTCQTRFYWRHKTKDYRQHYIPVFSEVCPQQHHGSTETLIDVRVAFRSSTIYTDASERRGEDVAQLHLMVVGLPVLQRTTNVCPISASANHSHDIVRICTTTCSRAAVPLWYVEPLWYVDIAVRQTAALRVDTEAAALTNSWQHRIQGVDLYSNTALITNKYINNLL